jgi:hypothetical protein
MGFWLSRLGRRDVEGRETEGAEDVGEEAWAVKETGEFGAGREVWAEEEIDTGEGGWDDKGRFGK